MNTVIIKRDQDWWDANINKIVSFYKEMNFWLTQGSLDNHPIRLTRKAWENNNFSL